MSTTTPPPSYDAAMATVAKIKAALANDPDKAQKAEAAMATAFADPKTNQQLLTEVRALSDAAIKIDQKFVSVSGELKLVDDNNYKDKNGNPVPKLKPQWDGFHNRFKYVLWASRDVATNTASYIKDFYESYLPAIEEAMSIMKTQSPEERKATMADLMPDFDEFLKKPNPATAKSNRPPPTGKDPLTVSQIQSQDFTDLKNDIEAFKSTFGSFAADAESDLTRRLNTINSTISTIEVEIAGYDLVIKAMRIAMGATAGAAVVGALGSLAAFGPLGPAVAIGVLIVGAAAVIAELTTLIVYLSKKTGAEDRLAQAKADKASLEAQLATLQSLKSKLQAQTEDINYITGRLDQFANIWSLVQNDAQECNNQLTSAASTKSFTFLQTRVDVLKRSYASLYTGLKEYATRVSDSKVPRPTA
ncbi:hypothetical protein FRC12_000899 [Ceratobasidium sp. 428]|nr:hypothetical protein FRC12_000899 [Ceratobasidium sp. 428]